MFVDGRLPALIDVPCASAARRRLCGAAPASPAGQAEMAEDISRRCSQPTRAPAG